MYFIGATQADSTAARTGARQTRSAGPNHSSRHCYFAATEQPDPCTGKGTEAYTRGRLWRSTGNPGDASGHCPGTYWRVRAQVRFEMLCTLDTFNNSLVLRFSTNLSPITLEAIASIIYAAPWVDSRGWSSLFYPSSTTHLPRQ